MNKEFDGMTTKELVIEMRKDMRHFDKKFDVEIAEIKNCVNKNKESLKWNWRLTWLLLTIFSTISTGAIVFIITASAR